MFVRSDERPSVVIFHSCPDARICSEMDLRLMKLLTLVIAVGLLSSAVSKAADPNQNPLKELQLLDEEVDRVTELAGLKPIFVRADELAKAHSGDFEVQLAVAEVKHKVVTRGTVL